MEQFSQRQLEQISAAAAELVKVHPELKLDKKRRVLQESMPGFARKKADFRSIVTRSLPAEDETEIVRHVEELVALSEGRPAILIRDDDFDLSGLDTLPDVLRQLLHANRQAIRTVIRGVGRIEVSNHPQRAWLGTGFVVAGGDGSDIVVTNRHVAVEMAFRRDDGEYQFVDGLLGSRMVTAALDLKEEVVSVVDDPSAAIPILDVLYIEDAAGPDLAFLRLGGSRNGPAVSRLMFSPSIEEGVPIAAIGYPAKDTRQTDLNVVLGLLGDVYNKKRLAPGVLKSVTSERVTHDCSTLGGNSGSPLIDLRSGAVVGLHYGGTFPNPVNYGVSARLVEQKLHETTRTRGRYRRHRPSDTYSRETESPIMDEKTASEGHPVTIELPLRITVEVGEPQDASSTSVRTALGTSIDAAVEAAEEEIGSLPGVANVRAGLYLANGQYSKEPAIVVSIDHTVPGSDATVAALPKSVRSFAVQVRAATVEDLVRAEGGIAFEGVPRINYRKPPDLSLDAVEDEMFAVFHVSPDAGWTELDEFLSRTRESLTIGLYNFAAEHVEKALQAAVSPDPRRFDLVLGDAGLDRVHTDEFEARIVREFKDSLGDRFRFELADGERRLFAGHYHIKVAVRDSRAFWLSSGNWEQSNQPDADPVADGDTSWDLLRNRNREWHAVVLNEQLARTFEDYIRYDLESYEEIRTSVPEAPPRPAIPLFLVPMVGAVEERPAGDARYFAPLYVRKRIRIQPLLTPDNYFEHVLPLVESATESIDLQNQTLKWRHQNVDERFERLMNTLLQKHLDGVRVRIILRSDFAPEMKELLIEHGFDPEQIRLQSRCHTKGMIVDSHRTLIGSHNLSEHGAFANRDASLIVDDEEVAAYFGHIFQFDWDRASSRVRETPPGISVYHEGDPVPPGYEVVSPLDVSL